MTEVKNLFIILITFSLLSSLNAQGLTKKDKIKLTREKVLIKKMKIKSKTLMVYVGGKSFKNLGKSCLYDTNGNKAEDYYSTFDGKTYKVNYSYDLNDRLAERKTSVIDGPVTNLVKYEYDSNDNLIREVWTNSKDTSKLITVYEYDSLNKLIRKINFGRLSIEQKYEYDELENLVNTIENNSFEPVHNYRRILKYDDRNRVIESRNLNSDGTSASVFSYKYDENENILEEHIDWVDMDYPDKKHSYEYDDKNNLIKLIFFEGEEQDSKQIFNYDSNGLLIEKLNFDGKNSLASKFKYLYEYY
ncbi:MAG: hypothetical protein ABIO41_10855 [Ignavibacteria bacterium]